MITSKRKKIIKRQTLTIDCTIRHKAVFYKILFVGRNLVGFKNNQNQWIFINKLEPIQTYELAGRSPKLIRDEK